MSFKNIFLVEDDLSLGPSLSERLAKDFLVVWKSNFKEAMQVIQSEQKIDLAILDIGLPDGNGFDLASELKKCKKCPIVFLTAQADADSRLKGYEIGADEFVPKPFFLKELLMRIHRVLESAPSRDALKLNDCEIRFSENLIIKKDGRQEAIAASDMKVLAQLINSAPKVISRDDIMTEVWGADKNLSFRTIDNIIVRLRQYLGEDGQKIKSIRGVGYQWLI